MEVQGLVVVELQAKERAQMAGGGEQEAGGGGLDLFVWSHLSLCPLNRKKKENMEQEA